MHLRPVLLCACLALARAATLPDALRNGIQTYESIPVAVLTHDSLPSLKTDEAELQVTRNKVDLTRTGPPQRQEHDAQSPEDVNTEQEAVASIKQTISDSQNAIEGVSSGLQSWLTNNQQLLAIKDNVQKLQANFQAQISKLNATLLTFWKPEEPAPPSPSVAASASQETVLDQVGQSIKENIEYGVKSMVNSVHELASVKQEPAAGGENNPFSSFTQYLQQFQSNIANSFNNLTSTIQNYINQNQQVGGNATTSGPSGFFQNIGAGIQNIISQQNSVTGLPSSPNTQSDEQTTFRPPTIWQGIQSSIQNIWRPGQSGVQNSQVPTTKPDGNRPIAQAIQGVANLIQPKPTDKPVVAPTQGTNQVPVEVPPAEIKPDNEKEKPEATIAPASGPIKQLVQKNPIMQGLATAVNRIQNTIVNPERPREVEKDTGEKEAQRFGAPPRPPHQNHTPAQESGDIADVSAGVSAPSDLTPSPPQQKEPTDKQDCDKQKTEQS